MLMKDLLFNTVNRKPHPIHFGTCAICREQGGEEWIADRLGCPGDMLHSVTPAHIRWLSKESQVVVPSAGQSSVAVVHADICLC